MRSLILAALAASAVATPAMAQENAPFTGLRAEAIAGWDRPKSTIDDTRYDGVVYGAQFGYDFQSGFGLLGVEGEITGSTVDDCIGSRTLNDPEFCAKAGRDLYAGARLGFAVAPSTLLYAKAGYTNARTRGTFNDGSGTTTVASQNDEGYRVGAGLEQKLGNNLHLKTEYRFSDYGDGAKRHQVIGGVGFRF